MQTTLEESPGERKAFPTSSLDISGWGTRHLKSHLSCCTYRTVPLWFIMAVWKNLSAVCAYSDSVDPRLPQAIDRILRLGIDFIAIINTATDVPPSIAFLSAENEEIVEPNLTLWINTAYIKGFEWLSSPYTCSRNFWYRGSRVLWKCPAFQLSKTAWFDNDVELHTKRFH